MGQGCDSRRTGRASRPLGEEQAIAIQDRFIIFVIPGNSAARGLDADRGILRDRLQLVRRRSRVASMTYALAPEDCPG